MKHKGGVNLMLLSEFCYNPVEPRRMREYKDSLLVSKDMNAIANLPTQQIHREWAAGYQVERFFNEANEG
jgi:hypothetical protein